MGQLRFVWHPPHQLTPETAQRIYMAGLDHVPWPSRTQLGEGTLVLERGVADSGYVRVPWYVEGHGLLVISTSTLMEREEPYHLEVELARGKLTQVRQQLADWTALGLIAPSSLRDRLHMGIEAFSRAATRQHEPLEAAEHARLALTAAVDVADTLGECYADQALAARHRQQPRLDTWLAGNLGGTGLDSEAAKAFCATFNAAVVPLSWPQIESQEGKYKFTLSDRQMDWCQQNQLKVVAGPLLRFDRRGLPDWLYLWEGDLNNVASFVSQHVARLVERYKGRVDVWQCAGRVHGTESLGLGEDGILRLVGHVIETVRHLDPQTPLLLSFDQPWGEYMSRADYDLSPWYFADQLTRTGVGLSGIVLEINYGYEAPGSAPRDVLEISRQLDLWSQLGLPLFVSLTRPTGTTPDPHAHLSAQPLADAAPGGWTPETQRSWIQKVVPLLIAKPPVRGVIWNQFRDSEPHDYPHGGLMDASGHRKPGLAALASIRQTHLHPAPGRSRRS